LKKVPPRTGKGRKERRKESKEKGVSKKRCPPHPWNFRGGGKGRFRKAAWGGERQGGRKKEEETTQLFRQTP